MEFTVRFHRVENQFSTIRQIFTAHKLIEPQPRRLHYAMPRDGIFPILTCIEKLCVERKPEHVKFPSFEFDGEIDWKVINWKFHQNYSDKVCQSNSFLGASNTPKTLYSHSLDGDKNSLSAIQQQNHK